MWEDELMKKSNPNKGYYYAPLKSTLQQKPLPYFKVSDKYHTGAL